MSSLVAIFLVINSSRGQHIVFRYPLLPQTLRDRQRDAAANASKATRGADAYLDGVYGVIGQPEENFFQHETKGRVVRDADSDSEPGGGGSGIKGVNNGGDSGGGGSVSEHRAKSKAPSTKNPYETLAGLSNGDLAESLCPNFTLCDKKFELTIDGLTFVGLPTSLQGEDPNHRGISRNSLGDILPENGDNKTIEDKESEIVNSRRYPPIQPIREGSPLGEDRPRRGSTTSEVSVNSSGTVATSSIHTPAPTISTSRRTSDNIRRARSPRSFNPQSPTSWLQMSLFHLVFVLESPELESNREVDNIYKYVVAKITAALRYEQLRCEYVRKEAELILAMREEGANAGKSYEELYSQILERSNLASTLASLFKSLSQGRVAHVVLNDYLDLSLQVPTIGPQATGSVFLNNEMMDIGSSGDEYDAYPVIFPWQTLLLLEDPEEILRSIPLDSSPTLIALIQNLVPTQSLGEFQTFLDCSLAQVFRLVAHLIYWRKAKLIHTINVHNIYVVSPQANLDALDKFSKEFNKYYPTLDLPSFLALLKHPKPYSSVINNKDQQIRNLYLDAITYPLRRDLIIQLHNFVFLMVPHHIKKGIDFDTFAEYRKRQQRSDGRIWLEDLGEEVGDERVLASPAAEMSDAEAKWVRALVERSKDLGETFEKAYPYFNGKYHIEQIRYMVHISRKQIHGVLSTYRDVLVTVWHY